MNQSTKHLVAGVGFLAALASIYAIQPKVAEAAKSNAAGSAIAPGALQTSTTQFEFCFNGDLQSMSCEDFLIATAATGRAAVTE